MTYYLRAIDKTSGAHIGSTLYSDANGNINTLYSLDPTLHPLPLTPNGPEKPYVGYTITGSNSGLNVTRSWTQTDIDQGELVFEFQLPPEPDCKDGKPCPKGFHCVNGKCESNFVCCCCPAVAESSILSRQLDTLRAILNGSKVGHAVLGTLASPRLRVASTKALKDATIAEDLQTLLVELIPLLSMFDGARFPTHQITSPLPDVTHARLRRLVDALEKSGLQKNLSTPLRAGLDVIEGRSLQQLVVFLIRDARHRVERAGK